MLTPADTWMLDHQALEEGGALYHFPPAMAAAYGPTTGHDLSVVSGLLAYVIDFVNRPIERGRQIRPVGQERLRQLLRVAAHGRAGTGDPNLAAPSAAFLDEIRQRCASIRWFARLERAPTGAVWRHHAFILDAEAFYGLIASLLMNDEHRACIGCCKVCGHFHVVKRIGRGRPERFYCGPEHRDQARDAKIAAYQRERRARDLLIQDGIGLARVTEAVKTASKEHADVRTAEALAEYAKALLRSPRKHR